MYLVGLLLGWSQITQTINKSIDDRAITQISQTWSVLFKTKQFIETQSPDGKIGCFSQVQMFLYPSALLIPVIVINIALLYKNKNDKKYHKDSV